MSHLRFATAIISAVLLITALANAVWYVIVGQLYLAVPLQNLVALGGVGLFLLYQGQRRLDQTDRRLDAVDARFAREDAEVDADLASLARNRALRALRSVGH